MGPAHGEARRGRPRLHRPCPLGARPGFGPLPLNLSVAGGDATRDELVERVGEGIYVTRLHYLGVVDPREGIITGMTRDGTFRIEGGKVTKPLVNLRFTTSFPKLVESLRRAREGRRAGEPQRLLRGALPVRHARAGGGDGGVHDRRNRLGTRSLRTLMVRILVGTRKGLFIFVAGDERRDWTLEGPHLVGWEVFHAVLDPRDGSIHAATNSAVYGATVHRSTDLGSFVDACGGARPPRGERAHAREDLARRAGPRRRERPALARRRAGRPLPLGRRRHQLGGGREPGEPRDARPLAPRGGRHVLPFDPARSAESRADVRRDLGSRRLQERGRRRELDTGQPGHRSRFPPRPLPGA